MTSSADAWRLLLLTTVAVLGAAAGSARAQSLPVVSQPVVQAIPGSDTLTLNAALTRLGRNPRDVEALVDAGNAAMAMGDVDAATGFYRRADQIAPGSPRVKAGLAGAMVRNGDPFGAIPLFDEAERAGALDGSLAADRGLAYDLVGDSASAQRYYRQALARGTNDEVIRRLALSQAIAGDRKASESTLSPLLQRQDKAAWRTRAFALAILGQPDEAIGISKTVLPGALAEGIAPYLRYMPRLTHAQQAAAANFGSFPLPSEIGRDDPRVAQYAPAGTRRPAVAAADSALVPRGEALGRNKRTRSDRQVATRTAQAPASATLASATPNLPASASQARASRAAAKSARESRVAPPDPMPTRQAAPASSPQVAAATPRATAPVAAAPTPALTVPVPARAAPAPAQALAASPAPASPAATAPITAPGFDLGLLPSGTASMSGPITPAATSPAADALAAATPGRSIELPPVAARTPIAPPPTRTPTPATPTTAPPRPAPVPAAPARTTRQSIADAFSEFSRPPAEVTPAAGAVDIRRIRPARPKAEQPAKPPPPSHPSRIWVQIATGRDKAALGFDWRRLIRKAPEAFRGKRAQVSDWGQTNRLLTGPFESTAAANAFVAQLRRADVDGSFVWTSPAGQVVDALSARDEPAPAPTPAPKPAPRKRGRN